MTKRGLKIGAYNTALDGQWLLTGLSFSDPIPVTDYVEVPGRRKGPLDLTASLTDGDPTYESRTLTATFESSEGSRLERENRIEAMTNSLNGWTWDIILPDDDKHYIVGRVSVAKLYNDKAHASVRVTATCEPWKYNNEETKVVLVGTSEEQTATLHNSGRLAVQPHLEVTEGDVLLAVDGLSWALSPGNYALPDLLLYQGGKDITYKGAGTLTFTYREAIL